MADLSQWRTRRDRRLVSTKLTIFAAASVVPAERGICAIVSILTGNAKANPGHGIPAGFWDASPALGAVAQRRTLGQTALCAADPILHSRVDLILYRTVARPTCRHTLSVAQALARSMIDTLAPALSLWLRGASIASGGVSPARVNTKA
jgi:heme O synthase-like polyprenyltransferase